MKTRLTESLVLVLIFILMISCGSNSSDQKQKSNESSEEAKIKNVVEENTYSETHSNDMLNFEQVTSTLHFITSSSVRFKKSNSFRKVYFDETATYRIEGNYVILTFPDESQSLEIMDNGNGLKSSDGHIFQKK